MLNYALMRSYLYNLSTDKYKGFVPDLIRAFLFFFSLLYGLLVRMLAFYRRLTAARLPCKVISVGNITLGGTGKTTLVEYIAKELRQEGRKVAILSRGYKRKYPQGLAGEASCENMGDEPYMLQKNLQGVPVIVDSDRVRGAKKALAQGVDTVILDDGFQQWGLKKDLEIVVIDAVNPFGNRYMLPRGTLREPLASLARADVFILAKTNLSGATQETKDYLSSINPRALIVESMHSPAGFYELNKGLAKPIDQAYFKNKAVALFSGIGDPDSFERLITSMGINIGLALRFEDHHHYTPADLDQIVRSSRDKEIDNIITTEKDAVRLCGLRIIFLRIELKITENEEAFLDRLHRLYRA